MSTKKTKKASSEASTELHAVAESDVKPTLGWFSATTIVAGSMLGSGIFIVSADITRIVGSPGLLIAIWLFAGILTIFGAISYGKLAAYLPKAGGQYVFLKEAWGEIPAFLYGWVLLTVIQTGFLAAVAVAFTKYLGVIFPAVSNEPLFYVAPQFGISIQQLMAVAVLCGLTLYNCTGIQNGAILQNIFTSLKVIALLLLTAVGLLFGHHLWSGQIDWSLTIPAEQAAKGDFFTLFAFASVGALFSADAWNYVTFIGGEVKEPRKALPRALLWGSGTVVVLYLLSNLGYLNLLTLSQIQNAPQDRVATAAMDMAFPGAGTLLIAATILISTFGCLNGLLLSGARVFYAMAKDGLLFKKFAELHPRTHSPNFSMWVQFIWASCLALSGTFTTLLAYIVFSALVFYIVTMLGLFKLAKRIPEEVHMTSKKDYIIPVLYLIGAGYIAFFLLFGDFFTTDMATRFATDFYNTKFFTSIAGLGLTLVGLPIYFLWKKRQNLI